MGLFARVFPHVTERRCWEGVRQDAAAFPIAFVGDLYWKSVVGEEFGRQRGRWGLECSGVSLLCKACGPASLGWGDDSLGDGIIPIWKK